MYLLHFERLFGHARHYVGRAPDRAWRSRLEDHEVGRGTKLLRHMLAASVAWCLVRPWPLGSGWDEERLTRQGCLFRHSLTCRATGTYHP